MRTHRGDALYEPWHVLDAQGAPFSAFDPFWERVREMVAADPPAARLRPPRALPPPPFAAAADAGFTASPRADGAVVYTHAASGLRLALASRRDGAGGLEHVVSVLDAGDVSLPAYLDASELAAAPGPDWRMLMSKLVVVVGGRDKRAAAGMGRAG